MTQTREKVLVLVKAAPTWSNKYGQYEVCTAGVTEDFEWRRLYPFSEETMHEKEVKLWDWIEVDTAKPSQDPRVESKKIDATSITVVDRIKKREEKRAIIEKLSEPSLDYPMAEKRSLTIIKPKIIDFFIEERISDNVQLTLEGKPFIKNPYGDIGLYYRWRCPEPCDVCSNGGHRMECFDWGANVLYKRYSDIDVAKEKVTNKCYRQMKYEYDSWFALGTHSRYPYSKWMIVGLLWMKK